ncbi:MAG: RCC1 domain-containing protein [Acidimicrobiia bacterium]
MVAGSALACAGLLGVVDVEPAGAGGSNDWEQIDAGSVHNCGITSSGRLFCWGNDSQGQLGDGSACCNSSTPIEVFGEATNWKQVDAGGDHTCALKTSGRLYCWGDDDNGQVGDGAPATDVNTPVEVSGSANDWKRVAVGGEHTCATKTSGRLYCWGDDVVGQLGDGTAGADSSTPTQVTGTTTDWKKITGGASHTCATKQSGHLFCWGSDAFGQLGDGSAGASSANPGEVAGAASNWKQPTGGSSHGCAVKKNKRLYCWGADNEGQLGDGPGAGGPAPTQVFGFLTTWKRVSAGQGFTCASKKNGRLYCWGGDASGQLGNGAGGPADAPVEVTGSATDWKQVAVGATHACARKANGRLYCWGNDTSGQLGDGTVAGGTATSPQEVVSHP